MSDTEEFEVLFCDWVTKIFDVYPRGCFSKTVPRRLMMSKVHKKYFKGTNRLSYATLNKIRDGKVCKPDPMTTFAFGLKLSPVDRCELLIRWGEAYLERHAFQVSEAQMKSFIRNWKSNPDETLAELNLDIIAAIIPPRAMIANGITTYLKAAGKSLNQVQSLKYSTAARFAAKGNLKPDSFKQLLDELKPKEPDPEATPEARISFSQMELTHEKLCANYIEAVLDVHLLDLTLDDLKGGFHPEKQTRLAAWLVRTGLPIWQDSQIIDTLYLP